MSTPRSDMTVAELAALVGGTVVGDATRRVNACNTLNLATAQQVAFLHNVAYTDQLKTTRAGCVILGIGQAQTVQREPGLEPLTAIEVNNPHLAWQKAVVKFHGFRQHPQVGISDKAVIHPSARIGKNVNIHPYAVVMEGCEVGDNTNLYPHVTLMAGAKVGSDCILYPSVTVYDGCIIGNRCILHAGAVVGTDGYGFATDKTTGIHHKIPQTGIARIEDDVEIGVNSAIERAVMEMTVIGQNTKIGNGCVVGHNCHIGPGNLLVSQVGIAGSVTTGKLVVMAGQAGVNGHLNIPDMVRIAAQSGVMTAPEEPNIDMAGSPAMEVGRAKRVYGAFMMLPELMGRLRDLEKQVKKLTPKNPAEGHG